MELRHQSTTTNGEIALRLLMEAMTRANMNEDDARELPPMDEDAREVLDNSVVTMLAEVITHASVVVAAVDANRSPVPDQNETYQAGPGSLPSNICTILTEASKHLKDAVFPLGEHHTLNGRRPTGELVTTDPALAPHLARYATKIKALVDGPLLTHFKVMEAKLYGISADDADIRWQRAVGHQLHDIADHLGLSAYRASIEQVHPGLARDPDVPRQRWLSKAVSSLTRPKQSPQQQALSATAVAVASEATVGLVGVGAPDAAENLRKALAEHGAPPLPDSSEGSPITDPIAAVSSGSRIGANLRSALAGLVLGTPPETRGKNPAIGRLAIAIGTAHHTVVSGGSVAEAALRAGVNQLVGSVAPSSVVK